MELKPNIVYVSNQLSIDSTFKTCSVEESIEVLNKMSYICLDTETVKKYKYRLDPSISHDPYKCEFILVQLGDETIQFVIDCTTIDILRYKCILESSKTFIIQNAQFDLRFFYYLGIEIDNIWDTLIAEAIITTGLGNSKDIKDIKEACGSKAVAEKYAERKVGLFALAKKYCNVTLDKSLQSSISTINTAVITYAAKDILYLKQIRKKQIKNLSTLNKKYGLTSELIKLEMDVVKAFSRMVYNGFNLNVHKYSTEVVSKVTTEALEMCSILDQSLESLNISKITTINTASKKSKKCAIVYSRDVFTGIVKSNINWNSPEQKLGILKTLVPEIESTGSKVLTKYAEDYPIFRDLIKYNKFKKLQDAFGKKLLAHVNDESGKIHTNVWQVLSTGRVSMSDPNLAQIPSKGDLAKTIRSAFIPRNSDYVIVGGDYSGLTK